MECRYYDVLRRFIYTLPTSQQPALLASLQSRIPPRRARNFAESSLNSSLVDMDLGAPSMISYKTIHQTNRHHPIPGSQESELSDAWSRLNRADGWKVKFKDDVEGHEWVKSHFEGTSVWSTWSAMDRGVLKADLLRYLLILVEGGVYTDADVSGSTLAPQWFFSGVLTKVGADGTTPPYRTLGK